MCKQILLIKMEGVPLSMQNDISNPGFKRRLFWEYNYDKIDWRKDAVDIIIRVIERGTLPEWDLLINFYDMQKVMDVVKNKIKFLPEQTIERACAYFKLKKEELLCYTWKQSHKTHWL